MIWLQALWSRIWPYLALIAAAFAAFFGIRQSGKAAGKDAARREVEQINRKAREAARNVEHETASMSDDAITDELMRDWVRNSQKR